MFLQLYLTNSFSFCLLSYMAPRIPKGFGTTKKADDKAEASKASKGRTPVNKDVGKKFVTTVDVSPSKKRTSACSTEISKENPKK